MVMTARDIPVVKPHRMSNNNPGIPQGFIKFGSIAHWILLAVHRIGEAMTLSEVASELPGVCPRAICQTLTRLTKYGFIHRLGKRRTESCHPEYVYSLKEGKFRPWERDTDYERAKKYRARKARAALRVASVFQLGASL